jgi:hypothetical protein
MELLLWVIHNKYAPFFLISTTFFSLFYAYISENYKLHSKNTWVW